MVMFIAFRLVDNCTNAEKYKCDFILHYFYYMNDIFKSKTSMKADFYKASTGTQLSNMANSWSHVTALSKQNARCAIVCAVCSLGVTIVPRMFTGTNKLRFFDVDFLDK